MVCINEIAVVVVIFALFGLVMLALSSGRRIAEAKDKIISSLRLRLGQYGDMIDARDETNYYQATELRHKEHAVKTTARVLFDLQAALKTKEREFGYQQTKVGLLQNLVDMMQAEAIHSKREVEKWKDKVELLEEDNYEQKTQLVTLNKVMRSGGKLPPLPNFNPKSVNQANYKECYDNEEVYEDNEEVCERKLKTRPSSAMARPSSAMIRPSSAVTRPSSAKPRPSSAMARSSSPIPRRGWEQPRSRSPGPGYDCDKRSRSNSPTPVSRLSRVVGGKLPPLHAGMDDLEQGAPETLL